MCNIGFFREACLGGLRLAEPTPKKGIQCFLTHNNLGASCVWCGYTVESNGFGCFATRLESRVRRTCCLCLARGSATQYIRIIQGVVGRSGPVECWSLGTVSIWPLTFECDCLYRTSRPDPIWEYDEVPTFNERNLRVGKGRSLEGRIYRRNLTPRPLAQQPIPAHPNPYPHIPPFPHIPH